MLQKLAFLMLLLGATGLANAPAELRAETCARCGCECGCHPVCRARCETRTETETEYGCECEDFCVPGEVRHEGCTGGCDGRAGCDSCGAGEPCCTLFGVRIYTRKKLMVREVTREVPTTEYVVEYLCPQCAGCGGLGCDTGCDYSYPAEMYPAPVQGSPPAQPQDRATFLESLFDRDR